MGVSLRVSRYLVMLTLVIAGEMVFGLPFHTARFFRPTLLDVFSFSNTQRGDLFAEGGSHRVGSCPQSGLERVTFLSLRGRDQAEEQPDANT